MSVVTPAGEGTSDLLATIERLTKPTQQFTRGWMLTRETAEHGVNLGFASGSDFWIVGRAGVLGECTAETAIAALGFHADHLVRKAWEGLPEGLSHAETSLRYAQRCCDWGDAALGDVDRNALEQLDEFARRIIDAAPTSLGATFAGWRAMPLPDSLTARVALTTQVMREMRGAAHLVAVIAAGLTPLDAILASTNAPPRTGPEYAERMGFVGPFRDPEEVRPQRLAAEAATNAILAPFFGVLGAEELATFADLYEGTRNAIDM